MGILSSTGTGKYFFEDRKSEIVEKLKFYGVTDFDLERIPNEPYFTIILKNPEDSKRINLENILEPINPLGDI